MTSALMNAEKFARRLLLLTGQGGAGPEYAARSSDAAHHLTRAELEARELARSSTFSLITAEQNAQKVIKAYERAEKEARAALAVATASKKEAEAVQGILRRVRQQVETNKQGPPTLT